MSVKKEDVEKFLDENPSFAQGYFAKKFNAGAISMASGIPEKQVDFNQFQELSQVIEKYYCINNYCLID